MFKNKLKLSALALTAVFLVGCSEIVAKPTDNDNLILEGLVTELEKNVNSVVYDALRDGGNITQKTLEDVMFLIAQDRLGQYDDDLLASDDAKDVALVDKIQRRINEKMYDLVASGQFETRNLFSERRFAYSIEKQLYPLNREGNDPWVEDFIFPPRNTEAILSGEILEQAIHLEYYQTFIEENLLPKIYRELLVEQYLIEKDYSALGRSYARKVNYVSLKVSIENPEAAKYLMDTFIDQYILDTDAPAVADLELLARAWRGVDFSEGAEDRNFIFAPDSPEFKLLEDAGLLSFEGDTYYEGATYRTLYGEILKRYEKIVPNNPLLTDKSVENEFTGNGQYTPETGLEIKRNEIFKRDFTTDGWHIKNGGLGSLPASIRDRVFNIGVANAIDRIDDEVEAVNDPKTSDFLRKINGVSYLVPQTSQQNDSRNFLLYDANTTTYYIVQVLDAVNTTKMNTSASSITNYDALENDGGVKRELIAGEIAKIIGKREASINASNLHWLKLADLKFHDQTIYDFFKSRFPTLYDEDQAD